MNALRLSAAVTAVAVILGIAGLVASCGSNQTFSDCAIPTPGELAADGGSNPCHCAPPPALNITSCPCLSATPEEAPFYAACMATFREEQDAGAEGGPISGCTGQCWPPPPDYWASPLLLWFGPESDVPSCPLEAPFVFYNGYAGSKFALACTAGVSGACSVPGEVCAPEYVDGFSQCVIGEGAVDCPILGPYTAEHVFYEEAAGQPVRTSTFCCFPAPLQP